MLWASVTKTGTTATEFLLIDIDARGCGMGSAFVAIAEGASGVYWNPAGLGFLEHTHLNYGFANITDDLKIKNFSIAVDLKKWGAVNFHGTFLTMDAMKITTVTQPDGTGEFFDAGSKAIGLSYAYCLNHLLSFGLTYKFINEHIYNTSANGYAFDGGILCKPLGSNRLSFGLSLSNYGSQMQMQGRDLLVQVDVDPTVSGNNPNINASLNSDKFDLPRIIRFGLATDLLNGIGYSNLNIVFDGVKPRENDLYFNTGYEYIFYDFFSYRMGFINISEQNNGKLLKCYGLGLRFNFMNVIAEKFEFASQERYNMDDYEIVSLGAELLLN